MVELKVSPSSRVSKMEIGSQGGANLVIKNNERIEWQVGGLLENLFYKLYDESGMEVTLTDEIASKIKVCPAFIIQCLLYPVMSLVI